MDDSWWCSPDTFKYTPRQIEWLLGWLPYLRVMGYDWPPKEGHEVMAFVTTKGGSRYFDGSSTTRARAVVGNLERLLCAKPKEGMMIKLHYCVMDGYGIIGRYFNLPWEVVERAIENRLQQIYRLMSKIT